MSDVPKTPELTEAEIAGIIAKYAAPVKYPKTQITDKNTGLTYNYINFDGDRAIAPYVNKQMFNSTGTKFVFKNDSTASIYEYDMVNETIMFLDKASCVYVAPTNVIYYCKSGAIWRMDWNTYDKRHLCDSPITEYLLVSTDEKYASGTNGIQSAKQTGRQNLTTGEVEWIHHDFSANPNTCGIGHTNVNPGYPEYLFFCNEGRTDVIPDRLWMHNYTTGQTYNFFVQAGAEGDINTQETSGHEVWAADGENMFWVKYTYEQNLGQSGIMRKNKEGTIREYINGDYAHWHCNPSGDNNWVVSDINRSEFGKGADIGGCSVALTNINTYESLPIAHFRRPFGNHPYHPHPHISFNANVMQWAMVDDNDVLGIAWMDISHITADPRTNTEIALDDKLTIVTNDKYGDYKVTSAIYNEQKCYAIEPDNKMYVKVNNDCAFTKCAPKVTLEITYSDNGADCFDIVYTSAAKSQKDLADRENKSVIIKKTNFGNWKTQTVVVENMALNNRCSHQTDFAIVPRGDSPIYISRIMISI